MHNSDNSLVKQLAKLLEEKGLTLSTAESCTGGGIGSWLTSLPGSSAWYLGGYICYSDAAKIRDLSVKPESIKEYGAVSEEVAAEMAIGAAKNMKSDLAISVTGIAGPAGGTEEKPVGTVCFGWQVKDKIHTEINLFSGDRADVQRQSIQRALIVITELLNKL